MHCIEVFWVFYSLSSSGRWGIEAGIFGQIPKVQRGSLWGTWRFPEVPRHQNGVVKGKLMHIFKKHSEIPKNTLFFCNDTDRFPESSPVPGRKVQLALRLTTPRSQISVFSKNEKACITWCFGKEKWIFLSKTPRDTSFFVFRKNWNLWTWSSQPQG